MSTRLCRLKLAHPLSCPLQRQCRFSSRYSNPSHPSNTIIDASPTSPANPDARNNPSNPSKPPIDRQKALRRLKFATTGLFFSVIALGAVSYHLLNALQEEEATRKKIELLNRQKQDRIKEDKYKGYTKLDSSPSSITKFEGKDVHIIGTGDEKRIITSSSATNDMIKGMGLEENIELVETGTSSVPYFPRTISLPSSSSTIDGSQEEYTLLGLGIRTVSFLSIQVYVLGMYIRTSDLSVLQARLTHYINDKASTLIPDEKEKLATALLHPEQSRDIWQTILSSSPSSFSKVDNDNTNGIKTAWRISPTRNTDFGHLRDGWITGIKKGSQIVNSDDKKIVNYEDESFSNAVKGFRDMFSGQGKAGKGSIVTLVRDEKGKLDVYFEKEKSDSKDKKENKGINRIGMVNDSRIGDLIWFGYLGGKNVSSESARKGVMNGCLTLTGRPVGSAETMIT